MDVDYMDIWMLTISASFIEGKEDTNLIFLVLDIINDAVLLFYIQNYWGIEEEDIKNLIFAVFSMEENNIQITKLDDTYTLKVKKIN